jgi:hypothetical protein
MQGEGEGEGEGEGGRESLDGRQRRGGVAGGVLGHAELDEEDGGVARRGVHDLHLSLLLLSLSLLPIIRITVTVTEGALRT